MSKYMDYACGPCNLADDIEHREQPIIYAGLQGQAAVELLRSKCCGMPCKYFIQETFGFPMLQVDYNFWRSNGRLPTVTDHEAIIRLRKANAAKNNTTADVSDFMEDGAVWGYEAEADALVMPRHSETNPLKEVESAVNESTSDDPDAAGDRWANVPKKKPSNGQRGRPSEVAYEVADDFEL